MIKLEHISKTFTQKKIRVEALKDINLEINDGEIFGIIGFSGAGKSTLVRCINLLERPTEGRVIIGDTELTSLEDRKLRKIRQRIGMIFQHFNLMPSRTVFENIDLPLKRTGMAKKERVKKIEALLEMVDLSDRRDAYPSQLSGGQKQRVAIARALACDPEVLLCDEATSALDPQTTEQIITLLNELNKKLKLTIVVITHQMSVVKELCDRAAVMENGSLVECGCVYDLFADPKAPLTKRFLDTASNIKSFMDILHQKGSLADINDGTNIWSLTYTGESTGEDLMTQICEIYKVRVNILYANIDYIKGAPLGRLAVHISGEFSKIEDAIAYIKDKGVKVEILK